MKNPFTKYFYDVRSEFRGYSPSRLGGDILAGITVSAVSLPLAIAFAMTSGADAAAGLVCAIIGGAIIGLLSGAPVQIAGPTGTMALIVAGLIGNASGEGFGVIGMLSATMIAGAILLICGLLKVGRFVELLPNPIITGFTSGIAATIAIGQIGRLFGVGMDGDNIIDKIGYFFSHLVEQFNLTALIIAIVSLAILILWSAKLQSKVPASLVVVIIMTAATMLFKLDARFGMKTVGDIPQTIFLKDRFAFTNVPWSNFHKFVLPGVQIAALIMIESLLCGVTGTKMHTRLSMGDKNPPKEDTAFNPNRELIAQGVGNLVVPLFGGVPLSSAFARTSVGLKAGGRTRVVGLVNALVLLICMFALAPIMSRVPMAALGAVLVMAAWKMNDWKEIKFFFKNRFWYAVIQFSVMVAVTIFADLIIATVAGFLVATLLFMYNSARLRLTSETISPDRARVYADAEDEFTGRNIVVVSIVGAIFFANAAKLGRAVMGVRGEDVLIIDLHGVVIIDNTGLRMLKEVCKKLRAAGVDVILSGQDNTVSDYLKRGDVMVRRK